MITMEMIDQFRKRTNCSYQEAKLFLEKNNGDLVEAIVDFERTHSKVKSAPKNGKSRDFFERTLHTRFIIEGKNGVILNVSVLFGALFVLFTIPSLPVVVMSLIAALLFGNRFHIKKSTGDQVDINKMFSDMTRGTGSNSRTKDESSKDDGDEYTVE